MSKQKHQEDPLVNVEEVLGETGQYLGKHQNSIIYTIIAVAMLIGGYFAYKYLYIAPQEKTAATEMFVAERYFEMDSMRLALNGDREHIGFLDVIDNYSGTQAANISRYYAGIAYLQLGEFENAITQLEKFDSKDPLLAPLGKAALADAYLELGDAKKAIKQYLKAAEVSKNEIVNPSILLRAALLYEKEGDDNAALKIYEQIQQEYTTSQEAREMDRYIARIKERMNK